MIGVILRIRYELTQELDIGPLFASYKARDRVGGRDVCVRVLQQPFATEQPFVSKLREVVRRSAGLIHPGIERAIELDEEDGRPFILSELAVGQPLSERIKKLAPFSTAVAVSTALSICEALEAVHNAGMVHGDVRSENVVVATDGSCKLLLAGIWEAYSSSRTAGAVVLPDMAPYLAPEITSGGMPSPSSDIYSVGILLYELLAGRKPYSGETAVAVAMKHSTAPVPSLRAMNPSAPLPVEEIIKKALAKGLQDRYSDVRALIADLRSVQDALRFGKPLTWPLKATPKEPVQVAPRMSAVRVEQKPRTPKTDEWDEDEESVPKWLMGLVYGAVAILVLAIGSYVFFNLNKPKLVRVPNLVNLSARDAAQRLESMGLKMRTSKKEANERVPEGAIIASNPKADQEVREHSHVSVVVSAGSKFVETPDLRGKKVDDAKSLLESMALQIEEPVSQMRDSNIEAGKIVKQLPEPHKKVERFTKIRLFVSGETRGDGQASSEVNWYRVRIKLPLGDVPINVRVDMTDDRETKTVYDQMEQPGQTVRVEAEGYGPEATFRIFFDGEPVKQVTKKADHAATAIDSGDGG